MAGWKYAFSLSKAEVLDACPPGTVRLVDHVANDKTLESGHQRSSSDASTSDHVVRYPRPSADPADPLNWSGSRKTLLLLTASLYAFVGNFQSAAIAPALSTWYIAFPPGPTTPFQSFPTLVHLIAVNVLLMGASNIWWVPFAHIVGRRPVLIAASLLMTLASMWCGLAGSNFDSLLAARIFQGMGAGPSETVAPLLVGEVFFMDERGRAMAIYTAFLSLGSIVGGIAGGYIAFQAGWAYVFWVSTALSAGLFVGVVLFVPETLFDRKEEELLDSSAATRTLGSSEGNKNATNFVENRDGGHHGHSASYRPYTFARSLGFGRVRTAGAAAQFVQPWKTLALPGTWVVMLHYAGLVGGIVTISTIGAQLVSAPPYLWGANAGLINIGGLIGVILGALYTYVTSDSRLLGRAKHEGHGFAEPESRLPTMFPALAIATAGFFVFGFCAQYPGMNRWVGLEVGYGMLTFGLMQVPSIGFNYLIDSYTYLAGDCFVIVTILRSIIAFAWTFFVSDWVTSRGPAEPFGIFGMLMGLFSLLIIPLWMFGKRMRVATASYFEF